MGYQDRMREEGYTDEDILLEARHRSGRPAGMPIEPKVGTLPEDEDLIFDFEEY